MLIMGETTLLTGSAVKVDAVLARLKNEESLRKERIQQGLVSV
jgi:hypothetical protein